ncbi:hypothetical protein FG081_15360 [Vibrio cholerae]|nr:hypothetical protein [Vibrio cholerae]
MKYFDDRRVTDSGAAKAYLLRQIRESQSISDEIIEKRIAGENSDCKRNAKLAERFFNQELTGYDEFLVTAFKFKKQNITTSKHFIAEYSAIEPELIVAEGVASLCRFIVGDFDSKKFCKRQITFHRKFASQFYFDMHFLYQCILRLNTKSIGKVGEFIYPVLAWLISENVPLSQIDETNFFVFRDVTLVTRKLPGVHGMYFKTILESEFYSVNQAQRFANAHKVLLDSKEIVAVMTKENGDVVYGIPRNTISSITKTIEGNSFWLRPLLSAPDIRFVDHS